MKKDYIFLISRGVLGIHTQNIIWYNTNYVREDNVFSYYIAVVAV